MVLKTGVFFLCFLLSDLDPLILCCLGQVSSALKTECKIFYIAFLIVLNGRVNADYLVAIQFGIHLYFYDVFLLFFELEPLSFTFVISYCIHLLTYSLQKMCALSTYYVLFITHSGLREQEVISFI